MKKYIEPLPIGILSVILDTKDFTSYRVNNSKRFKIFLEVDEKDLTDDDLRKPESFTDILIWGLWFQMSSLEQNLKDENLDTKIAKGFYSLVELCEFYLFFTNSLVLNDLYYDYSQLRLTGSILSRDYEDKNFKSLHPFLQMIFKINGYLEDKIYYGYKILNCGKPIKEIVEFEQMDFEDFLNDIINLIEEYLEFDDKSSWNEINPNWLEIYKKQVN